MSEAGQGAGEGLGFGVQVQGLLGNFWQCSRPECPCTAEPRPWARLPTPLLRVAILKCAVLDSGLYVLAQLPGGDPPPPGHLGSPEGGPDGGTGADRVMGLQPVALTRASPAPCFSQCGLQEVRPQAGSVCEKNRQPPGFGPEVRSCSGFPGSAFETVPLEGLTRGPRTEEVHKNHTQGWGGDFIHLSHWVLSTCSRLVATLVGFERGCPLSSGTSPSPGGQAGLCLRP